MVVSGDDGLYGEISAINTGANTITITNVDYTPSATFATGSVLEPVAVITYELTVDDTITRDSGFGAVLMAENATLSIDYLDSSGTAMVLPLTEYNLINDLHALQLAATLTSSKELSDGELYTITVSQFIGLRNFNYFS